MKNFTNKPMELPLFPIAADIVVCYLEMSSLTLLFVSPSFYFRYVDDIALIINQNYIEELSNIFNNYHLRIKFMIEMGGDTLNFLDITIVKEDTNITHN